MRDSHRYAIGQSALVERLRGQHLLIVLALVLVAVVYLALAPTGSAQSPEPSHEMTNFNPGGSWPGTDAGVVEGTGAGVGGCAASASSIENQTVQSIDNARWVITEITPQAYCGTLSQYETVLNNITNYVVNNATSTRRCTGWAGIMLDEESGYGFSVAQLETLNNYVNNMMNNVPSCPNLGDGNYWFTEDAAAEGTWTIGQYNGVIASSIPAPQIYNSHMQSYANQECSQYGNCQNLVTECPSSSVCPGLGVYNSSSYGYMHVNGTPWWDYFWGGTAPIHYFYNIFN
jgi:hypothetical protein